MSTTFSAAIPTHLWFYELSCPFDSRRFKSYEQACAALAAHSDGPCAAGAAWASEHPVDDWDTRWPAETKVHEDTGKWVEGCLDTPYTTFTHRVDVPSVNMSQTNAREVIAALGLFEDDGDTGAVFRSESMSGSAPAQDVLGRALMALALVDDPGRPGTVEVGPRGATLIDAGRPVGYVTSRLERIVELAQWASQRGLAVCWG